MTRRSRLLAFLLTAAALSAGGCSSDKPANNDMPAPMPFVPPGGSDFLDAGGAQQQVNPAAAKGNLLVDPGGKDGTLVSSAIIVLTPTKKDGKGAGTVKLAALPDGIRLKADLTGLQFLSNYSLYAHVTGDCSADDASSAGPTFNFDGSSLDPPSDKYGGMAELSADVSGNAKGDTKVPGAYIQGPFSLVGRSVVLHASNGDKNNPSYSTGERLACGVVAISAEFAAQ
jgi:Cu-Zn family superoxide dismutase